MKMETISAKWLFLLILSKYVANSLCEHIFPKNMYYLNESKLCAATANETKLIKFEKNTTDSIKVTHKFSKHLYFNKMKLKETSSTCIFKVQADKNNGIYVEITELFFYMNNSTSLNEDCLNYIQFRAKNQTSKKICGDYKNKIYAIDNFSSNSPGSRNVTTVFVDMFGDIEVTIHIEDRQLLVEEKIVMLFTPFYKCDLGDGDYWMSNINGCIIFNQFNTRSRFSLYNFTNNCPCENHCLNASACILKPSVMDIIKLLRLIIKLKKNLTIDSIVLRSESDQNLDNTKVYLYLVLSIFLLISIMAGFIGFKYADEVANRPISILRDEGTGLYPRKLARRPARRQHERVHNILSIQTEEQNSPITAILRLNDSRTTILNDSRVLDNFRTQIDDSSTVELDDSPPAYKDLPQPPEYETLFTTK